jgi:hypothetical protein
MLEEKSINIFASRDRIRYELIKLAQSYLELQSVDLTKTNYLSYLINILSVLTSNLLYYSTSIYKEFFLTRATQKSSVINLASMLGYKPPFAVPATGPVMIELPTSFENDVKVIFEKGMKFYADTIVFTLDNKTEITITRNPQNNQVQTVIAKEFPKLGGEKTLFITYDTPQKEKVYFSVNVTQQELNPLSFQIPSTLRPYEFFMQNLLFSGQVASLDVVSTSTKFESSTLINLQEELLRPGVTTWKEYESLFLIPRNVHGYTFRQTDVGGQIFFGNGVVGVQPTLNDTCMVLINTTQGSKGNVIAGTIIQADRVYVDDSGILRPVEFRVINTVPMIGGIDTETIDQIRAAAIAQVSALKRLVTEADYGKLRLIAPELPVRHTVEILKRSDIKHSEIVVFSDIIFDDVIVPTKDHYWDIDEITNPNLTIHSLSDNTNDKITIDGTEYYSMFNLEVNPTYKSSHYYYILDQLQTECIINNYMTGETQILPVSVSYTVLYSGGEPTDLLIEQYYEVIANPLALTNLTCELKPSWSPDSFFMTHDDINKKFTYSLPLTTVPEGELTFVFYNRGEDEASVIQQISESQSTVIAKQSLDDYMYSQIKEISPGVYRAYDVPLIKKSYYDSVDKNSFTISVYQRVLNFDVTSYRMLTDFVNLKFSNTTGICDNMKYNKTTKDPAISINPATMPLFPNDGDRYVVTGDEYSYANGSNPWSGPPWNKSPGFIAEYILASDTWVFEKLDINDIIIIESLGNQKYIYNGNAMLLPYISIPFEIKLIVWQDGRLSYSKQSIITTIKNTLVDRFYKLFGFENNIYMSQIIDVVQSIPGVKHCKLIEPQHDIFFNFDYKTDLTQEEILEYSPQLIFFDTTSITIEMR